METLQKQRLWENLLIWSGLALLYFLSGKLSFYLSVTNTIVTIAIFFAEGVSLAAVLIYGKRVWPGVIAGQFALAISTGLSFLPSLLIALVNSVEIVLAYYLFRYFHFDKSLRKLDDLYLLFGLIIFVLQPFSALLGNIVLTLFSVNEAGLFFKNLFSWWFGNVMGQMLVTPMLLIFYRDYREVNYRLFFLETLFFTLFCYVIFFHTPIYNFALLLSVTITMVVLILVYTGFFYAMSSVLILSFASLFSMHEGVGAFTIAGSSADNLININFYIFAHIFVIYIYGVLMAEKDDVLEKLEGMNTYLEERVREEVDQRQEKEKMLLLHSRQAQMGEMISMITHQWRQPLNTLSLLMQNLYIKYQLKVLDDTYMQRLKQEVSAQIDQMSLTMEDFRNFFKPQREKKRFDVSDTVRQVLMMLEPLFRQESISIRTHVEGGVYIEGYANELAQVLINILNNAKDAILYASKDILREIELHVIKESGKVKIVISDHAGGIDEEILQKIFNPYFSTKEENMGTGLGLYMSRIIIEKHMDGKLYAQNHEDGAMFVIELDPPKKR